MNIRNSTPNDSEAIAALHAASWRLTYDSVLSRAYLEKTAPIERETVWTQRLAAPKANQCVLVAESKSGLVGFACAFASEHAEWGSYFDNLHVRTLSQGQGIGKALLVNVARWCEAQAPGQGLYLSVNQENRRAQQFYLGLGARNAKSGIWNAPDGSSVPTYWFVWHSVGPLVAKATNPSIQETAFGGLGFPS